HEAKFKKSIVQPALLQRFVNKFREFIPPIPPSSMLRIAVSFLRRKPHVAEDEYGLHVRCTNRTDRTINDLKLEVEVPSGYELALFENPRRVEGRSAIQTRTKVRLQIKALPSAEHVGLRILLSVPTERYPVTRREKLRLLVFSGDQQLELTEWRLNLFLDGPPSPP